MKELEVDQDHQAAAAEKDRRLAQVEEELSRAEQPVVQALAEVGVEVQSVWDLVNTSSDYSPAVPVLEVASEAIPAATPEPRFRSPGVRRR